MKSKKYWLPIAVALGAIGIIIILAAGFINPNAQSGISVNASAEDALETKLKALCERVDGVSDVTVAVFFESGTSTMSGVGIVCRNGSDPEIQRELISLISAVCGIGSNKIFITEAQK